MLTKTSVRSSIITGSKSNSLKTRAGSCLSFALIPTMTDSMSEQTSNCSTRKHNKKNAAPQLVFLGQFCYETHSIPTEYLPPRSLAENHITCTYQVLQTLHKHRTRRKKCLVPCLSAS